MAKKNLTALMQSIMGERTDMEELSARSITNKREKNVTQPPVSPADSSESSVPKKSKGRPRKENNETVATFKIDRDVLMKLKYISLMEECMQKEVLHRALTKYFDEWESSYGPINLPSR